LPEERDEPPLSPAVVLASLLVEHGLSKRGFARMLHEADPRQSWDSWLTSVKRYTRDDDATTPTEETVALMEKVLGVPAGTLVRLTPQERRDERIRLLEAENQRLRAELEKRMRDEPGSGRGRAR